MDSVPSLQQKTTSAPPPAPQPGKPTRRYDVVPLGDVALAADNYRKTYSQPALVELAGSIRAHGVEQPILVQPGGTRSPWEVVHGERRHRASSLKGPELDKIGPAPTTIPVLILSRRLTEKEIDELRLVENHGREDVPPLEEAEHFDNLIKKHGHSDDTIAELIGKSAPYVRARRQLLKLPKLAKEGLASGKLPTSKALIISRVALPLQDQFAKKVLAGKKRYDAETRTEVVDEYSYREVWLLAQTEYMTKLDGAPFPIADATLVPEAGSCTVCPKRTGNQPELFAEVKSADVCTDTICFDGKRKAEWDRQSATATREGRHVLSERDLAQIFPAGGVKTAFSAAWVDLRDALPHELEKSTGKKTWGALAGREGLPKPALGRDGSGAARDLYKRDDLIKLATQAGRLKKETKKPAATAPGKSASAAKERQKTQLAFEAKRKTARAALAQIAEKAAAKEPGLAFWRWLATAVVLAGSIDAQHQVVTRRALPKAKGDDKATLLTLVEKLRDGSQLRGLVAELAAAEDACPAHAPPGPRFSKACELFDVDVKKIAAAIATEQKAAKAEKPKARKKGGK